MGAFRVLVKWTIVIIIAVFCIQYWLHHKAYLFSIDSVAGIAERYVGRDPEKAYPQIAAEFRRKYPGHILPEEDTHWMFMNAGGWMGSMYLLHASLTEYVLFFGSAVNTSGHSGRYWATISDTLLTGKFTQWKEGSLTVDIFRPGDTVVHEMGEATCVNFAEGTWMVEYGRGFIPSTLGFALADTLFSTQDFVTLYYILKVYAKAIMQETMFYLMELRHSLKESL